MQEVKTSVFTESQVVLIERSLPLRSNSMLRYGIMHSSQFNSSWLKSCTEILLLRLNACVGSTGSIQPLRSPPWGAHAVSISKWICSVYICYPIYLSFGQYPRASSAPCSANSFLPMHRTCPHRFTSQTFSWDWGFIYFFFQIGEIIGRVEI